jgi:hypothetical protein
LDLLIAIILAFSYGYGTFHAVMEYCIMTSFTNLVELRPEVTDPRRALHGIVSLSGIISDEPDAIERSDEAFLDLTYPSEAMIRLLARLNTTFHDVGGDRKGLFVIRGGYGSGKSHVLVALYHLLHGSAPARAWLQQHKINFSPPQGVEVVLMPMINLRLRDGRGARYLWEPIFERLGYDGFMPGPDSYFPTEHHIREALGGRPVALIIDELERWLLPIGEVAQRQANLTFLQNLTSYAQDGSRGLIVLITLLGLEPEVDTLISRADRWDDDLTGAPDRAQMVLHRLVRSVDHDRAEGVVETYMEVYRAASESFGDVDFQGYEQYMLSAYPFHPEVIRNVFDRYSSVARAEERSYQNSRGALRLLGHMLEVAADGDGSQLNHRNLLLTGDIAIDIRRISNDLNNLNPKLLQVARNDLQESQNAGVYLARPILSAALLHSLGDPEEERLLGAQMPDLLFACLRPGEEGLTPTDVETALGKLGLTAVHLHHETNPERWRFKESVNLEAQVIRRAGRVDGEKAVTEIVNTLHELVPDAYVHPQETAPDRAELVIVLADRKLADREVLDQLYHGRQYPNGLVIVEPRDHGVLTDNQDILALARRRLAAKELQGPDAGSVALEAGDLLVVIEDRYHKLLKRRLQDSYGLWRRPVGGGADLRFAAQTVVLSRDGILHAVGERYDVSDYRSKVSELLESRPMPLTVAEVCQAFYRQRTFPKPMSGGRPSDEGVHQAIRDLVASRQLTLIKEGDAHFICGSDPGFLQDRWSVRPARREDFPDVDIRQVVYQTANRDQMMTLREAREQVHAEAARRELRAVTDDEIYTTIQEMAVSGQVEIPDWDQDTPVRQLPESFIIRRPQAAPRRAPAWETIRIGPTSRHAAITELTRQLGKTDALRDVEIEVEQAASGAEIGNLYGALIGAADWQEGRLHVRWTLREVPIRNRDGLLQLLQRLSIPDDAHISIECQRQRPARSAAGQ